MFITSIFRKIRRPSAKLSGRKSQQRRAQRANTIHAEVLEQRELLTTISSSVSDDYQVVGQNQFAEGEATIVGYGFQDATSSPNLHADPLSYRLPRIDESFQLLDATGYDLITIPFVGTFAFPYDVEVNLDLNLEAGVDVGFYVNSGSVDLDYDGSVEVRVEDPISTGMVQIDTFYDMASGNVSALSPRAGAYADLVFDSFAQIRGYLDNEEFRRTLFDDEYKAEILAVNRDLDGEVRFMDNEIGDLIGVAQGINSLDELPENITRDPVEVDRGVTVGISQPDGLLGLRADVDYALGASVGGALEAGVSSNLGSVEVTVPRVDLDSGTIRDGKLTATTDDNLSGGLDRDHTRVAAVDVNLTNIAAMLKRSPIGLSSTFEAGVGPVSLEVVANLIEIGVNAKLFVDQEIEVIPSGQLTFDFGRDVTYEYQDGNQIRRATGQTASVQLGDYLAVEFDGEPINVTPTWVEQPKLANRIGLDLGFGLDVQGIGFGSTLDVGVAEFEFGNADDPLIDFAVDLGTIDLGDVYDNEFQLPAQSAKPLPSFSIGEAFQEVMELERVSGGWSIGWETQVVGDFSGDGLDDIANYHPNNQTWWVAVSNADGSHTVSKWADFNNGQIWAEQLVGDFNGDGRDDIASMQDNGNWLIGFSNGTQFNWSFWNKYSQASAWKDHVVGDFNDDGKDDIASISNAGRVYVRSVTNGSLSTGVWANVGSLSAHDQVRAGDFNGDGDTDLAFFQNKTWKVGISNGSSSLAVNQWRGQFSGSHSLWTAQVVGDFNGDGLDDIANYYTGNGTWWVTTSTGSSFDISKWGTWYSVRTGWQKHEATDFNNDGKDDILSVHATDGLFLSLSHGDSIRTQKLANSSGDENLFGDFDGDGFDEIMTFWNFDGSWRKKQNPFEGA